MESFIVDRYGLVGWDLFPDRSRDFPFRLYVHRVHSASCPEDTWGVKVNILFNLPPSLRKRGNITPFPHSSPWCGDLVLFLLPSSSSSSSSTL
jgi:hypothetical protein